MINIEKLYEDLEKFLPLTAFDSLENNDIFWYIPKQLLDKGYIAFHISTTVTGGFQAWYSKTNHNSPLMKHKNPKIAEMLAQLKANDNNYILPED